MKGGRKLSTLQLFIPRQWRPGSLWSPLPPNERTILRAKFYTFVPTFIKIDKTALSKFNLEPLSAREDQHNDSPYKKNTLVTVNKFSKVRIFVYSRQRYVTFWATKSSTYTSKHIKSVLADERNFVVETLKRLDHQLKKNKFNYYLWNLVILLVLFQSSRHSSS